MLVGRYILMTIIMLSALSVGILAYGPESVLANKNSFPASIQVNTPEGIQQLITYQPTVIEAIDEAGIKIGENDLLSLPDNQILAAGASYELSITRRSNVTLSWSGYDVNFDSEEMTMRDLISRSGFSDLDTSQGSVLEQESPSAETVDGATLTYVTVNKQEYREYEAIPFSRVNVDDPDLFVGESEIRTEGKEGSRAIIFEDTFENGIFISRVQTGTEVIENPVQEVTAIGTKKKVVIAPINSKIVNSAVMNSFNKISGLLQRNGNKSYSSFTNNGDGTITVDGTTFSYQTQAVRTVTMYDGLEVCLQKGCHTPAINHNTYSGVPAQRGLAATYGYMENGKYVGSALPMGTILFVEGYGLAVVADIHGMSNNSNLIDVCFDPGEIRNGTATIGKAGWNVYILSVP